MEFTPNGTEECEGQKGISENEETGGPVLNLDPVEGITDPVEGIMDLDATQRGWNQPHRDEMSQLHAYLVSSGLHFK